MRLIQTYLADMLNGEGLRNVYFFTGCSHHCNGCFSPETWDPEYSESKLWLPEDFEKLIEDASKPYISGITLSGGDPFFTLNRDSILDLCKEFKSRLPEKTIWVYTGFTWEQIIGSGDSREECLKYIDVLCDGPFIERLKSPSKPWVGSENQRVIDVKKSLNNSKVVLYA